MCSESSRRASSAAWSRGCSVFTRPSRISGEPVNSATSVTSMPGLADRRRGAAGGEDLDAQLAQPAGEVDDPGLVGDRDQRPANADRDPARRGAALLA